MGWDALSFKVEFRIAEELEKRSVLFFTNARGRYSLDDSRLLHNTLTGGLRLISLYSIRVNVSFSKLMAPNIAATRGEIIKSVTIFSFSLLQTIALLTSSKRSHSPKTIALSHLQKRSSLSRKKN